MAEHPGIVFRPGPAGRRPALAGGPDIWEVIRLFRQLEEEGEDPITHTAEYSSVGVTVH